ncbi:MAG: methyltransferase [Bacteroidales bacterium]
MKDELTFIKLPPVWLFRLMSGLRQMINTIHYKLVPANVAVFEKAQKFWIAKALGVACELNLADIIGSGFMSIDSLARETGTDRSALYRLMRALASDGIFREIKPMVFVNTPESKALMEGNGSMKYMIRQQMNRTNWEIVNELGYSIETGNSGAIKVLGTDIFDHLRNSPEKNELYNKAMTNTSDISAAAVISAYDFSGIKKMIDIGGGEGYLLSAILSKYPSMQGVVFDFKHVVETADKNFKIFGIENRAETAHGNFFETIPAGGDAYMMKNIIHAFDDPTCINLLNKVREAMMPDSRLLILDAVIRMDNKPSFGKIFDLQMLLGTKGGKERTENEFDVLLQQSGFQLKRIVDTVSPFSIVEAVVAVN